MSNASDKILMAVPEIIHSATNPGTTNRAEIEHRSVAWEADKKKHKRHWRWFTYRARSTSDIFKKMPEHFGLSGHERNNAHK